MFKPETLGFRRSDGAGLTDGCALTPLRIRLNFNQHVVRSLLFALAIIAVGAELCFLSPLRSPRRLKHPLLGRTCIPLTASLLSSPLVSTYPGQDSKLPSREGGNGRGSTWVPPQRRRSRQVPGPQVLAVCTRQGPSAKDGRMLDSKPAFDCARTA